MERDSKQGIRTGQHSCVFYTGNRLQCCSPPQGVSRKSSITHEDRVETTHICLECLSREHYAGGRQEERENAMNLATSDHTFKNCTSAVKEKWKIGISQ